MIKAKDLKIERKGISTPESTTSTVMVLDKHTNELLFRTQPYSNTETIEFNVEGIDFIALPSGRILMDYNSVADYVNGIKPKPEEAKEET